MSRMKSTRVDPVVAAGPGPANVRISGVTVTVGDHDLIAGVDLEVPDGAVLGLLGPNGSGKSTLLRTLYRSLRPAAGRVLIGEDDVWSISPRSAATRVAAVTQDPSADVDFSVLDVVLMGRTPHKRALAGDSAADLALAMDSLRRVDAIHLIDRSVTTLSGGERQRVMLARALTQTAPVLVLDEPTNHLDICHQLDLLALVRRLRVTTVVALHDLNLAHTYCDLVTVLRDGVVVATGAPDEVLTPALVSDVFDLTCHALTHPVTGRPLLAFSRPDHP